MPATSCRTFDHSALGAWASPAAEPVAKADADLLTLWQEAQQLRARLTSDRPVGDFDEENRLCDELAALEDRMARMPATTLAGVLAKMESYWISQRPADADCERYWDTVMLKGLRTDLMRLAGASAA